MAILLSAQMADISEIDLSNSGFLDKDLVTIAIKLKTIRT